MTTGLPGTSEADVAHANGGPGEDGRQAGNGKQPVENNTLLGEIGKEGEQTDREGDEDGDERTTATIDVGEDLGGLVEVGKGGECTGGTEDGGVADGEDSKENNRVHYGGENSYAGVFNGNHKGRRFGIGLEVSVEQAWVVERDEQTNKCKGHDVEERDAPKDLLDRSWEGFAWVGSFGSRQTNEFGAGEGKGCSDEDTASPFEAVVKGTGVNPVFAANVATFRSSTNIKDDTEEALGSVSNKLVANDGKEWTHMKPMTATTLMMEKINSASP